MTRPGLRRRRQHGLIDELPEKVRGAVEQRMEAVFGDLPKLAADRLPRCFGCDVPELVRETASSFSIALSQAGARQDCG